MVQVQLGRAWLTPSEGMRVIGEDLWEKVESKLISFPCWIFYYRIVPKCWILFFFFLAMPRAKWLVRSQLPDQGLNPGHGGESAKSLPLDRQGIL